MGKLSDRRPDTRCRNHLRAQIAELRFERDEARRERTRLLDALIDMEAAASEMEVPHRRVHDEAIDAIAAAAKEPDDE